MVTDSLTSEDDVLELLSDTYAAGTLQVINSLLQWLFIFGQVLLQVVPEDHRAKLLQRILTANSDTVSTSVIERFDFLLTPRL